VPASRASAPASRGSQDQDLSLDERLDRLRENALRLDRLEEIALGLGLLEKVETAPVDTGLVRQLSASWLPAPTKFESRQTSGTTVAPDSAPHSRQSSVDSDASCPSAPPASVVSDASCPGAPPGRRLSSRPMSFDMSDPDMKAPVAMPIPDTPAVICINSESDSEGECDDERAPSCERDECLRSDECDERLMGL
jgi:hypothetical protein